MLIPGEWYQSDDGAVRPIFRARVPATNGKWLEVEFLLDTGADRTVLAATALWQLALETSEPMVQLSGIGGSSASVVLDATIRLPTDRGTWAEFKGSFSVITDPFALDMSVLGRDILDLFAGIVDRPGNFVGLVGGNHRYAITSA